MFGILIRIILDEAARHIAHTNHSIDRVKRATLSPTLLKLGFELSDSMADEFSGDLHYRGGMAAGFNTHATSDGDVEVTQSAAHDSFVRQGTKGGYKGFPYPVKEWAISKLGLSDDAAGAVAASVADKGTSEYMRSKYPSGARYFRYPEYVATQKERGTIEDAAEGLGDIVVSYALGKARRVVNF